MKTVLQITPDILGPEKKMMKAECSIESIFPPWVRLAFIGKNVFGASKKFRTLKVLMNKSATVEKSNTGPLES